MFFFCKERLKILDYYTDKKIYIKRNTFHNRMRIRILTRWKYSVHSFRVKTLSNRSTHEAGFRHTRMLIWIVGVPKITGGYREWNLLPIPNLFKIQFNIIVTCVEKNNLWIYFGCTSTFLLDALLFMIEAFPNMSPFQIKNHEIF